MMEEYAFWLALSRIRGLGGVGFKRVAEHFTQPTAVFDASEEELTQVPGLDRPAIEGILNFSGWEEIEKEIDRAFEAGVAILPYTDSHYPGRLRMIPDPPPALYLKGELRSEDEKAVAVVGSRSASEYGLRMTRQLSGSLAQMGFTVVSGMARGIDGQAHQSALEAGGRTIAVLGSGVDVVYPPEHGGLYAEICGRGAILSELSMGTPPFPFNFPARNRLISGLSLGVIVVEATEKSGSLITASLAVEQGREVFAVPGEAGLSRSRGTHRLIREGAKLVERAEDVVEEIAPQLLERARTAPSAPPLPVDLSGEAKAILESLLSSALQIDELIQTSGLSSARVSELLLDLEIRGLVKQMPGKRFRGA